MQTLRRHFASDNFAGICPEAWSAMAELLHSLIEGLPRVKILSPCEANGVFADLPPKKIEGLRAKGWLFYTFIGKGGCRFMCSWDTTESDVRALAADLQTLLRA